MGRPGPAPARRSPGAGRPRRGRTRAPAVRAQLPGPQPHARRRPDRGRSDDRRDPPDRRCDRKSGARERPDDSRRLARRRGASVRADRSHLARRRLRGDGHPTTTRDPCSTTASAVTMPRATRAWEAFQPDPIGYGSLLLPELAEAASRTADRALLESALDLALRAHRRDQLGVGDRNRSACARTAQRGRGRREPVPRVDRAPRRYPRAARARPDSPSLRGVAATRTPPRRRPKAFAHRARGVHEHGRRRVRAPRRTRAAGDRRACPQTDRGHARPTHSAGGADRAPGREGNHQPRDRRSAVHQPRAPSSTTCARHFASST